MRWVIAFVRFWYDFIVGDDWLIAVGIVAAIAVTALIAHHGLAAWWVMPLAVIALLAGSLRRALRKASDEAGAEKPS
jgi:membrane protein implicated in regulation of membrane protease activity